MNEIEITFVRDYEIKDGTGTCYRKGQVVRVSEPSATHFINRGAAILDAPSSEPLRAATSVKPRTRKVDK